MFAWTSVQANFLFGGENDYSKINKYAKRGRDSLKRMEDKRAAFMVLKMAKADNFGIDDSALNGWVQRFQDKPDAPIPGSGKLWPEEDRLQKLERENRELRTEVEILKKAVFEYLEIFRFTCLLNGGHCDLIKKGCKFTI